MSKKQIEKEMHELLCDLKRCGTFYESAIELFMNCKNSISGDQFEKRIDELLKQINS